METGLDSGNVRASFVGVTSPRVEARVPGSSSTQTIASPTLKEQLHEAEVYLEKLQADRAEVCRELEEEAKLFLESPSTPEQEKRFKLIYQLVRFHIHTQSHNRYSLMQEKVACLERVQEALDGCVDDAAFELADARDLMIAVSKGKIIDATIRVTERGLEAMRELNGRGGAPRGTNYASCAPAGLKEKNHSGPENTSGTKVVKRSRLPAAAVKEMRTWLDKHWDDPVPTHEEKVGFAQRHSITTKQVENWFINVRMREWRPAMRRALDHAEETGSYAEFSRLLQHTADGNVFKKFLEERELGKNTTLVPPPSLQRFIGVEGFAAFCAGEKPQKRQRPFSR